MKGKKIGEDKYTEHWSLDGHSYVGVPKWVVKQVYEWGVKQTLAEFFKMNIENPKAPVNIDEVKRRALSKIITNNKN